MKRIFKLTYVVAASLLVALSSCSEDDPTTGRTGKSVVTATQTTYTIKEGQKLGIELNVDTPLSQTMEFKLQVLSTSTATMDDDYAVDADHTDITWGAEPGYKIVFPAYASSHTIDLSTVIDFPLVEDTETVTFKLTSAGNGNGLVKAGSDIITVNIENETRSPILDLTFNFDTNFDYMGTPLSTCMIGYDVDIIVYDENGNDLGVFDGQTGACPEMVSLDMRNYPDGTYVFKGFLYDDSGLSGAGITPAFDIPINVDYDRPASSLSGTFNQNAANYLTSDSVPGDEVYIMTVVIDNGNYTIMDNTTVVATGKVANGFGHSKMPRKAKKANYFN